MTDNPFGRLGIPIGSSRDAIKKAYKQLALKCHPDMRQDKEVAAVEFRELTRIYELALANADRVPPPPRPPKKEPAPPERPPVMLIVESTMMTEGEEFEVDQFGMVARTCHVSHAILYYGGTLTINVIDVGGFPTNHFFAFTVPHGTKNGQTFQFQSSLGPLQIKLVGTK